MERMWVSFAFLSALVDFGLPGAIGDSLQESKAEDMQPRKADRSVLFTLLVVCVGALGYAWFDRVSFRSEPWPMVLVVAGSILAGSLCAGLSPANPSCFRIPTIHPLIGRDGNALALALGFSCVRLTKSVGRL